MQRENRIFTSKIALIFKFANLIFVTRYPVDIYAYIGCFSLSFLSKKWGENREKHKGTIGAFSKYLKILRKVS